MSSSKKAQELEQRLEPSEPRKPKRNAPRKHKARLHLYPTTPAATPQDGCFGCARSFFWSGRAHSITSPAVSW